MDDAAANPDCFQHQAVFLTMSSGEMIINIKMIMSHTEHKADI